ncbi:MAG: DUF2834 domain-containing protein [Spirochaetae bacterium HGW-Spirochaetae-5]|nr:MAG: DUF2834 domain-containing protein [Spirochaetae bacterium HGW-Spirochaetae-5]
MQRIILIITLIGFLALTAVAVWFHGVWGIFEPHFKSFGAAQVFVDLIIALVLFMVWMWRDAKSTGRNPWPWIILTMLTGSIAPLIYLITRKNLKDI